MIKSPSTRTRNCRNFAHWRAAPLGAPQHVLLLLLFLLSTVVDYTNAFGVVVGRATAPPALSALSNKEVFLGMMTTADGGGGGGDSTTTTSSSMTEIIAEAVDGDILYTDAFLKTEIDAVVDETDKLLSKRVPVAIRYSADAGMKPYFLTVAKRLKEKHPDVILDKVILPKIEGGGIGGDHGGGGSHQGGANRGNNPIFEVMVDGKVVIPTVGKKDRDGMGAHIIFVSMQELDLAISRARRRRRPSTVYGEEEANVRLEILKAKAAAVMAGPPKSSQKVSHKHSKD